ncbi:DUF3592 domain-containing protein [Corallococcus exiguus]|uniref:DUF3592 domain-containing protein n=1 Tax=Corallococcus exiguus TaxID=83462 RepID=UPI001471D3B0|nr:DUF3592 domain-containing protein [Corallococcus exiguus]NNB85025.1 DUF3592 domain-containing protein [Corallococcus exiguus]NNC01382.1 DUF3592 domain-containing protein [Corallococcus exiguus]
MSSRATSSVLWLLVLLPLTAGMLTVDFFVVSTAVLQAQSTSWPTVQGTITRSEVETVRSNKSTTYRLKLAYTYSVDGQSHEGGKRRLYAWSTGDLEPVEALVTRYPVGATIPVYYRPAQPSEAVLQPGPGSAELFMLMFLLPFNLLAIWPWIMASRNWRPEPPLVPTYFREDGSECVTLTEMGTTIWVFLALGGSAFLCGVLGGVTGGHNAPAIVGVGAWGVVIACGVLTGRLSSAWRKAGRYDLRLHVQARSLSLPPVSGRKHRLDLRWRDVRAIRVDPPVRGNQRGSVNRYPLTLEHVTADGEARRETIDSFLREEQAEAMAHWLRTHLDVGEAAPEERRAAQPRARPPGRQRLS